MNFKYFFRAFLFISSFTILGCAEHKVDTVSKYCEKASGVNLSEKYFSSWALVFSVKIDAEAVRNEYTNILNQSYIEKTNGRSELMAWRTGNDLHLINLSGFFRVEPEKLIEEWKRGIDLTKDKKNNDPNSNCLYGVVIDLFDSFTIHSMEPADALGTKWVDTPTLIMTKNNL